MEIKTEEKNKFCKLCFQYCDNNLEVLKDEVNKMLEFILFTPDYNIGGEQIICSNCSSNIEISFKFKSSCLNTENYIISHRNSEGDSKVNLNEIYVNRIDNKDRENLSEGAVVCRLCMNLVQNDCWTPLDDEKSKGTFKLLKQWLPELDLNISKNPVMCISCQESLENYFGFIKKCTNVEEKHYGFKEKRNVYQNEWKLNSHFKLENDFLHEDCDTELKCQKGGNVSEINNEIQMDIETHKMNIEQAEIYIKSENANFSRNDDAITLINEDVAISKSKNVMIYKCENCKYETKYRYVLKKHSLIHKYTYCCDICSYKSDTQDDINIHTLIHKDEAGYSCEVCSYKTKYKSMLNRHNVIHSDLGTYKCKVCKFKTRHKHQFGRHMKTHESLKFQCEDCDFQTNRKNELEKHSLLHLPDAETQMLHCANCKFITKTKKNLVKHMILHQKKSPMNMYRCDVCDFQTKHKHYIKLHVKLTHQDPSERRMYACDMCDYKSLYNSNVRRHKLQKHGVGENK